MPHATTAGGPFRPGTVRGPLSFAVALILGTMVIIFWSPFGEKPRDSMRPMAERSLIFADAPGGRVLVTDARSGATVAEIAPGEGGFVRGALRGLARDRTVAGIGREVPFRLVAWSDGRLTLEDPATGTKMEMAAYGQTNAEAFLRFLQPTENQR